MKSCHFSEEARHEEKMTNFGDIFKQAQQLQTVMQELQEELANTEIIGQSAGGMCQVTLNGKGEACSIKIDPSLLAPDSVKTLEDLLLTAFNHAKESTDEKRREKMSKLTGGLSLPPGMQLPF